MVKKKKKDLDIEKNIFSSSYTFDLIALRISFSKVHFSLQNHVLTHMIRF